MTHQVFISAQIVRHLSQVFVFFGLFLDSRTLNEILSRLAVGKKLPTNIPYVVVECVCFDQKPQVEPHSAIFSPRGTYTAYYAL